MRITVVCDVLGEENNGTTIAAMNLIRTMRRKGHDVRVVCPDAEREGQPGFYTVSQMNFGPFNNYIHENGVVVAKKDEAILERAMEGADAVHVLLPFSLGKAAAHLAVEKGLPLTASFHCQAENIIGHLHITTGGPCSHAVYRVFYDRLYKYCDLIHFPTQFIRDKFEEAVGHVPGRVISNGVNSRFTPAPDARKADGTFTLLYTARYGPEKCHEVLLDAVAESRYRQNIRLILAGSGPREEAIKKHARKLGIPMPVMRFFGRDEMLEVIRSADLYVHAAKVELESIACLEAIACGVVPLIADSPLSASKYFALSDRNLFRYDDPKQLAEKIDWWLDNPAERAACSKRYEGFAEQFNFDKCMDKMEQMLIDAVEMKKSGVKE